MQEWHGTRDMAGTILKEDPNIKWTAAKREDCKQGSQRGPWTPGHAPSPQATQNERPNILGNPITSTLWSDTKLSICWSCGESCHLQDSFPYRREAEMTGAGNVKIGHWETLGNRQESLNGDWVITEKQTTGVANCRKTSGGWRIRVDTGVDIKAPPSCIDCHCGKCLP
jgi:hypothetical protein